MLVQEADWQIAAKASLIVSMLEAEELRGLGLRILDLGE